MSRIHQALQQALREIPRAAEKRESCRASTPGCETASNVELICRGETMEPGSRPSSGNSRSMNGHFLAADVDQKSARSEAGMNSAAFRSASVTEEQERTYVDLTDEAREQLANVVQRVFLFPNSRAQRVVAFSSVDRSGGSSNMCFHTAQLLAAEVPGSVCMVDANSELSSLNQLLGLKKLPGLSNAIRSSDPVKNFATQIAGGNLWLLAAGTPPLDGSERFFSDRMRSLIVELRTQFDYVLIDAPPVTSPARAVWLGQLSDGMILIVEANSTRRDAARTAKETLEGAKVKLLGAILNNHTPSQALFKR
jgi:Mrp family chromosome partitioning ATPase